MIGVMIIPTGIGASIGGHAGDATPAAKLIAECCDKLIIHPNVVNASDINEMTPNMLYVEGSILDRFLEGRLNLKEVRQNKILIVTNLPIKNDTINAIAAAEATIGIKAKVLGLKVPLRMRAENEDGKATGVVHGWKELVEQVGSHSFDALAIHTPIEVSRDVALNYYRKGGVNPWGGVEAKASRLIADAINRPVAHAPLENTTADDDELFFIYQNEEINRRMAAEVISNCYFHCVLKGLHKAPALLDSYKYKRLLGLSCDDVDFLVSPDMCYGRPHKACQSKEIPVIVIKENTTVANKPMPRDFIFVNNYWEAAGVVMSMRAGMNPESVRADCAHFQASWA